MKKILPVLAIVIPVIATFVVYYLESETSDVVYSISDNIPVSDAENAGTNTQQIEIKNLGSLTAKDIQLKIDADISNYRVINDSASDKVNVFHENIFELLYSELPPDGQFTLVIESDIKGLDEDILTIKSDDGIARNVLENDNNKIGLLIYSVVIIAYILFSINTLKSSYTYSKLKSALYYSSRNVDFIYSKKPIYIKDMDWAELLNNFLQQKIREDLLRDYIYEVDGLNTFKILLNKDKPKYLTEDEWGELRKKAAEVFKTKIRQAILGSKPIHTTDSNIITFLTSISEAAEQLSDSIKRELGILISNEYVSYKIKKKYINLDEVNNNLLETKPIFVSQNDWDTYKEFMAGLQYMLILQELFKSFNDPYEIINRYQDTIVKDKEKIIDIGYSINFYKYFLNALIYNADYEFREKPDWLKDSEIRVLDRISNIILKSKKDIELANKKNSMINQLILREELIEVDQPEFLNDQEWRQVISLNDKFKKMSEFEITYQSRSETLEREEIEASKLIEKVRYQLNTIHNLLLDPSTIDRIESYDNYFSEGNFLNLVKLADYLKETK
ncbi:hypothetical protein FZD47_20530 [Bacillus infantis]|uniref:CARDB domain-containing protein n=1 Tax=Bacillus infantis TaxID=324767 RepID=A0A5D4SAC8_9BACI|nr:hypothetical protein [Bacillus infantis]TYS60597.1 hypothetical protein FZD47_20530 [Bacillus infantis]